MSTVFEDLPAEIKEKIAEELEKFKCVLYNQNPIGKGSNGYVYRVRREVEGDLIAVEIVLIPKMIDEEREVLLRSIDKEEIPFK